MWNSTMNVPQTLILFKIASVILAASSNFQRLAKITEAILNKTTDYDTFRTQFCNEIHLLNDDSRYHVKK